MLSNEGLIAQGLAEKLDPDLGQVENVPGRHAILRKGGTGTVEFNTNGNSSSCSVYDGLGAKKGYETCEDAAAIVVSPNNYPYGIVAVDGLGGGMGRGLVAAEYTVDAVVDGFERCLRMADIFPIAAAKMAARKDLMGGFYHQVAARHFGATMASARFLQFRHGLFIEACNAGDSKVYVLCLDPATEEYKFLYVSPDQTEAEALLTSGQIGLREYYEYPDRAFMDSFVHPGGLHLPPNRVYLPYKPEMAGRIMNIAVTDGVCDCVSPEEILQLANSLGRALNSMDIVNFAYNKQVESTQGGFNMFLNGEEVLIRREVVDHIGAAVMHA